jgi:signal transduction histidine kinase
MAPLLLDLSRKLGFMRGANLSAGWRYGLGIVGAALALATRLALDNTLGEEGQPYVTLYLAVALVAWWVGMGPAIVTLALGLLSCLWLVVPPRDSIMLRGPLDLAEIGICLLTTFMILGLVLATRSEAAAQQQSDERRQALAKSHAKLEEAVRERNEELEEAIRELEHLSHAIVHDMRAPLRAVHSYSYLLSCGAKAGRFDPQASEQCERMMQAAERMDHLIRDFLSYTTILRREMPITVVDIASVVPDVVRTHSNLQQAAIQIIGPLPRVLGNRAALEQCFAHLLDNAVKFVPPGVSPCVQVRAESRGSFDRIWVEDNGIGIRKEDQGRIFRLFQQVAAGASGTGLGLPIVQKAVRRMNGRVGVESAERKGSRFWVELPDEMAKSR